MFEWLDVFVGESVECVFEQPFMYGISKELIFQQFERLFKGGKKALNKCNKTLLFLITIKNVNAIERVMHRVMKSPSSMPNGLFILWIEYIYIYIYK